MAHNSRLTVSNRLSNSPAKVCEANSEQDHSSKTPMGHANASVRLGSGNLDTCRLIGTDPLSMSALTIYYQLTVGKGDHGAQETRRSYS